MTLGGDVNRALLDVAERLVREHEDYAAGAVLRCFARGVRRARASGVGVASLPGEAEKLARRMLAARDGTRAQGARVPALGRWRDDRTV